MTTKNKVQMPDPVAIVGLDDFGRPFGSIFPNAPQMPSPKIGDLLITTDQAEAYAQAVRREALEEAAQACEARIGQHSPGMTTEDVEDCDEEARLCAGAIRALIPQEGA